LLPDRDYKTSATRVESGDLLVVYTDGLNETTDSSDVELGHDAIEREIARLANRPLREIQAAVFALARNHGPQVDDMTILLVRPR
jgi:sigma-B regulation protein RsbU (phosphoserine phosphatase)